MGYLDEPVDRLPFGSPERARRYATERYRSAVGLNWYDCDPTLQFLVRRHLGDGLGWAEPHLRRLGELIGGPIAARAEETDRNGPRLERYDRWGHDISRIVMPSTFEASRRDLIDALRFVDDAPANGVDHRVLVAAWGYLLDEAEIGMMCALGTGADMVEALVERFAPDDIKERVRAIAAEGFAGETAQLLTERTGGADLAEMETTATPAGDAWLLNGFKWFASNANGRAWVVLAKAEGAPDGIRGINTFLVLPERRDGSRNGVRIRRLKEKLGTTAVASAEVELIDAEAFLLSGAGSDDGAGGGAVGDGRGLSRMMEMTNGARLGIAMMGVGVARRCLVEALLYAESREAFGRPLAEQPLMQRKLTELIVEVEAAQALVFDGYLGPRLRIGAPLIKLRAARLGITAASDAIEVHGGNGYVETWPVARLLRDAQVNTIWEGPDNILCLDVRRGIEREGADEPFLDRVRAAIDRAPAGPTTTLVAEQADLLREAIVAWRRLDAVDRATAEARLWPLAQFMVDVYAASLLLDQAADDPSGRKALLADLYVDAHLSPPDPLRGVDRPARELDAWKQLRDGTLVVG